VKQDAIAAIFFRRHPEYRINESRWHHCRNAYSGGAKYIDEALIRHISELELEFAERRRRAYYFNYPRAIAGRITQYVMATEPVRRNADIELVSNWNRGGLSTNAVMRQISTMLNIYGRAWLSVEAPRIKGTPSKAQAQKEKLRPYARALSPLEVTDWAYGSDGKLLWAIVAEEEYCNADPFAVPTVRRCRRLYERDSWRLFVDTSDGFMELDSGVNPLGAVPLVEVVEPDGIGLGASHWFEDVVRISEAILNNESEAQMNVVKQMFGLLVISDAFARGARRQQQQQQRGSDSANNGTPSASPAASRDSSTSGSIAATLARSAAVIESVEEKGISRFISPSGIETSTIRSENLHLKEELFDVVGLAVQGKHEESRSAESKEWDFHLTTRFLSARAELLENAEKSAWEFIHGFDNSISVPEVSYNRQFAVRDLSSSISTLLQISSLPHGNEFDRSVKRAALEILNAIQPIPAAERQRIFDEIALRNSSLPDAS
jgi:hypothetical protein